MGVAAAVWLGALATLAIPLAIHLWSRRRTTPVPIGSIRLLQGVPPLSRRTFRLRDPWRLALRLVMLSSLILALAGTYLTQRSLRPSAERWLVVSPTIRSTPEATRLVDSLGPLADHVRLLHWSWPPVSDSATGAPGADTWTLLQALDERLPPGSRIDVVAPARTGLVRGRRPVLDHDIVWFEVDDSRTAPDKHPAPTPTHTEFAIYTSSDWQDDGRYLEASIRALHPDTVVVNRHQTVEAVSSTTATWLAWLSPDPPPAALLERVASGAVLLTDVETEGTAVATTVALTHPAIFDEPIRLHRRGSSPVGAPVWRDGDGRVLLSLDREDDGLHYRLATRLHPAWTDMVLRGEFPTILAPILGMRATAPDRRMTVTQITPARGQVKPHSASRAEAGLPLFYPLWLLAVLLFVTDMALAARRRPA